MEKSYNDIISNLLIVETNTIPPSKLNLIISQVQEKSSDVNNISLSQCKRTFLIFIGMILIALVILIGEIVVFFKTAQLKPKGLKPKIRRI